LSVDCGYWIFCGCQFTFHIGPKNRSRRQFKFY